MFSLWINFNFHNNRKNLLSFKLNYLISIFFQFKLYRHNKSKIFYFFQVYLWVLVLYFVGAHLQWLLWFKDKDGYEGLCRPPFYIVFLSLKGSSLSWQLHQATHGKFDCSMIFYWQKENDKCSLMFSFGAQLHTTILLLSYNKKNRK